MAKNGLCFFVIFGVGGWVDGWMGGWVTIWDQ